MRNLEPRSLSVATWALIVLGCAAALTSAVAPQALGANALVERLQIRGSRGSDAVRISVTAFVQSAVRKTLPTYPRAALVKKAHGVAVASVTVSTKGDVENLVVVQAPCPEIADAVYAAVSRWKFLTGSVEGGAASRYQGKLVFYFDLVDGNARVTLAEGTRGKGSSDSEYDEVKEEEIGELAARERCIVLDIRNREVYSARHRPDAVNIPADELVARAPHELDRGRRVLIDCSVGSPGLCLGTARVLQDLGFRRVTLITPSKR